MKNVAVIGAGAAGCFSAIRLKRMRPEWTVTLLEAGAKPLAKVAVTGGGRCNLTHDFSEVENLADAYPRGAQLMKRALRRFSDADTVRWFEAEGVPLVLQDDGCWFPRSQDAMQIVRTLLRILRQEGVEILCNEKVTKIEPLSPGYRVHTAARPDTAARDFDIVIVTTGGSPRAAGLDFLAPLDLERVPPVPSLFAFNLPGDGLRDLTGTVISDVALAFAGTKFKARGTLLLTDWGVSGPATLRLSSYAARYLAENEYNAELVIHWLPAFTVEELTALLASYAASDPQKQLSTLHPEVLTSRLWCFLLERAGLRPDARWGELGRKGLNRLAAVLTADPHSVRGKNRFREEFVTCGGVALSNMDLNTLEAKRHPGLFLAGEVLDIDAITGGFNLQAAWTTGFVAATSAAADLNGSR